jgi:sortase (surface protein transpeptidase)
MAAHVDSVQTGIGPFARLRDVAAGAAITVTSADGATRGYRVVGVEKIAKEGAPVDQWFDRSGAPRLVLVTCGGTFRRDIGHYTDNVVVTAEPIGG